MKKITALCILLITAGSILFSCKKEDENNNNTPSTENCKVLTAKGGGTGDRQFEYDAKGLVKTYTIQQTGFLSKAELKRDASGQLISGDYSFNGLLEERAKYVYQGGLITKVTAVNPLNETQVLYVNNIRWDAQKRMIEYTYESGDPLNDNKTNFEYNAQGILIKTESKNLSSGVVNSRTIITPAGTANKASETYLMDHGLPYDFIFGLPYSAIDAGPGSTYQYFSKNSSGVLTLDAAGTVKSVLSNSKGFTKEYVVEFTGAPGGGVAVNKTVYTFDGCN